MNSEESRLLGRMESKLDRALELADQHEARLDRLEKAEARRVGFVAGVSAIIGVAGGVLANAVVGWFKGNP